MVPDEALIEAVTKANAQHFTQGIDCRCGYRTDRTPGHGLHYDWLGELTRHQSEAIASVVIEHLRLAEKWQTHAPSEVGWFEGRGVLRAMGDAARPKRLPAAPPLRHAMARGRALMPDDGPPLMCPDCAESTKRMAAWIHVDDETAATNIRLIAGQCRACCRLNGRKP